MTSYTKTNYVSIPEYNDYGAPMIEVGDISPDTSSPYNDGTRRATMDDDGASPRKNFYETDFNISISGSRRPIQIQLCPYCKSEHVRTRTRTHPSAATWACVGVGAIVFFPLCWVPLVTDDMKKTDHYCQNCHKKIGSVRPFEGFCVKEQY